MWVGNLLHAEYECKAEAERAVSRSLFVIWNSSVTFFVLHMNTGGGRGGGTPPPALTYFYKLIACHPEADE